MNRQRAHRHRGNRGQPASCLLLISILLVAPFVYAQDVAPAEALLSPPASSLVPVHPPDLNNLEATVREQLASMQSSLAATIDDVRVGSSTLANAYGAMGQTYHAYSFYAPARECYLNASRLAPEDFRWIYLLAKLDQQEDLVDDAIARYETAAAMRPDYPAVTVNLGNIYLQTRRYEEAKDRFEAALANDPHSAAALYGLGQAALAQRRYAAGATFFERALDVAPEANRIHYSLAMAYRGLGNIEKARWHLEKQGTVGVRVGDPLVDELQTLIQGERVYLTRGKMALEAKRFAEAATAFRKAIAANPDSIAGHVNLGAALFSTGDVQGALEQYEQTLRIDRTNTNAHFNLAVLLADGGKHEQSIRHLQSVVELEPRDTAARFLLARQLLKAGRPEEALAEFSRVVEADPGNEEALLDEARLLQRSGQFERVRESLERGHALYPQKGLTAAMLANVLAASPRRDLRDGARALELAQLVYAATGSVEHGALVAMALAELGRCGEAAELQRNLVDAADQQGHPEWAARLRPDLERYRGQPCRPP